MMQNKFNKEWEMHMTGIQQTKVVIVITKIQRSQDTSEIKPSSFMVGFSSPQNIQISVSMKKHLLFNINI